MNVLVVDHQDSTREDLCEELSQLRYVEKARSASSESIAEEILTKFTPDIVFLNMQLPESGAFRFTDRSWAAGVPVIVCTTVFEHRVVEALSRHRVEYLVRPFGAEDLHYVLTRGRRPDPIDPILNLRRLLDAAMALGFPVRGRISTWQHGRQSMIEANEIAAIRYVRGRFYLWTPGGIRETAGPAMAIETAIDPSFFHLVYPNALISTDRERFGGDLRRARLWLERCHFADVFLRRQPALAKSDRADSLFGNRA